MMDSPVHLSAIRCPHYNMSPIICQRNGVAWYARILTHPFFLETHPLFYMHIRNLPKVYHACGSCGFVRNPPCPPALSLVYNPLTPIFCPQAGFVWYARIDAPIFLGNPTTAPHEYSGPSEGFLCLLFMCSRGQFSMPTRIEPSISPSTSCMIWVRSRALRMDRGTCNGNRAKSSLKKIEY